MLKKLHENCDKCLLIHIFLQFWPRQVNRNLEQTKGIFVSIADQ